MIYILDAYNVIHKIKKLESALDRDLRTAREALSALCRALLESRGGISQIILVFDGRSEFRDLPQAEPPGIRFIFSETDEDADERIVRILEELPHGSRACVVSDDNFVRNHARAYSSDVMSAAEFEALTRRSQEKSRKPEIKPAPGLSPREADEITAEYKKRLGLD